MPLKGSRPGTDVTRCTEAGVYAPAFVAAVVQALQACVSVGGVEASISPQLRAGGAASPDRSRSPRGRDNEVEDEDFETREVQRRWAGTETPEQSEDVQAEEDAAEPEQAEEHPQEDAAESEQVEERPQEDAAESEQVEEHPQEDAAESEQVEEHSQEDAAEPEQVEERTQEDAAESEQEEDDNQLRGVWRAFPEENPDDATDPGEDAGPGNDAEDLEVSGAEGGEEEEEVSVDPSEEVELAIDEIGGDQWIVDWDRGLLWVEHNVPRTNLIMPCGRGSPFTQNQFQSVRWTRCEQIAGDDGQTPVTCVTDDWRLNGTIPGPYDMWCGHSVFLFQGHPEPSEFPTLANLPVSQRGPEPEPSPEGQAPEPDGTATSGGEEQDGDRREDRRGGGSAWTSFEEEGLGPAVEEAAKAYLQTIDEIEDAEVATWRRVVQAGDHLLEAAGTVTRAAIALWILREKLGRNNLQGVDDPALDGHLHPDWLACLRDVREHGMAARYLGLRERVQTQPHPRARANMNQVYKQLMKDVAQHRVLVVNAKHPKLTTAVSSPFEAVPKMLPNRTLSQDVRLVHDQRRINCHTDKTWHPPAVQPLHQQVARRILFLKTKYPNVGVSLAKKDVAGAFRLLWVDPRDVELFGGELPWQPQYMGSCSEPDKLDQDPGDITLLYLVSSFGFSGSPGEWNVWGRATEELHREYHPAEGRRDGTLHFDGKILVDDMVLIEPNLGLRPWVSSEVYEGIVRKLLGEKAINAAKDAEEGFFAPSQMIWGLNIHADEEKMSLPEARVAKGAHLLNEAGFSYGEKTLTLKELQRFRGIATGWATIVAGLKNELKAADVFLGGVDGAAIIQPGKKIKTEAEMDKAWEDLWELFEDCRWLCARSETWAEKFGGDIRELLPPLERLALPGQPFKEAVFVSSDATLEVIGAVDWSNGLACRERMDTLRPWIQQVIEADNAGDEATLAIHVGEMLSLVAFACKVGSQWTGKVVIYGGDNKVVYNWVNSRRSNVKVGRILIRVLNLVEMRFRCQIIGGWWRTFHNEDADAITRLDDAGAQQLFQDKGWKEVDIKESIAQALQDTERFGPCFLSWADHEDRLEKMRLRELRVFRAIHRPVPNLQELQVIEWTAVGRRVLDFQYFAEETAKGPKVVIGSTGPDPHGRKVQQLWAYLNQEVFQVAVLEGPREVAWELFEELARKAGFKTCKVEFLTSELGEVLVRRRVAAFAHTSEYENKDVEEALAKAVVPPSLGSGLGKGDAESFVPYTKQEAAMGQGDRSMLPTVGGHVWFEDGQRHHVYRLSGPGRWPLTAKDGQGVEETYVLDKTAPAGKVRKLTALEVWMAQGRTQAEWEELRTILSEQQALKEGCQATGRRTSLALLGVANLLAYGPKPLKAGMCKDVEDYKSLAQVLCWLRRWRQGEFARALDRKAGGRQGGQVVWLWAEDLWLWALEEGCEDVLERRAGGRGSKERRSSKEAAEKEAAKFIHLQPGFHADLDVQAQVEEWLEEHMDGDKAKSTKKVYQSAWGRWCDWAKRQKWATPYLSIKEDPVVNENKLLGYLGYLGWLGSSVATLKQAVFAIKDAHKRAGHGDATGKMHRLWIVITSLERNSVRRPRRLGVTVPMLKWVGEHLIGGANSYGELKIDCRMLQAALLTAWFFMLRASEFADSNGVDEGTILRGQDIQLSSRPNEEKENGTIYEVTLQFRKTKSDQEAFGTCKTMLKTGVQHVCVYEALENFKAVAERRFDGPGKHLPLFRWASGQVLKRLEIQNILQKAAKATGLPAERFQSHSLRIGGASALFQATGEIELVKRTGRWSSSAVQRYLHDSGDVLKGLSKKMAEVDQFVYYT